MTLLAGEQRRKEDAPLHLESCWHPRWSWRKYEKKEEKKASKSQNRKDRDARYSTIRTAFTKLGILPVDTEPMRKSITMTDMRKFVEKFSIFTEPLQHQKRKRTKFCTSTTTLKKEESSAQKEMCIVLSKCVCVCVCMEHRFTCGCQKLWSERVTCSNHARQRERSIVRGRLTCNRIGSGSAFGVKKRASRRRSAIDLSGRAVLYTIG